MIADRQINKAKPNQKRFYLQTNFLIWMRKSWRIRLAKAFCLYVRCSLMCVIEEVKLSDQDAASIHRIALKKGSEMIPTKHLILIFWVSDCDHKNC
ncbi:hypothetical protein CEXT_732731 [Caerostris extrusa]|uniref:Uncharacterized protein n=1 Tax=Caerostris extrusa TaxID=172846 RepID=A0AAV4QXE1_CAEEX|nr:hypothetical protein CEXT_732731 [Caerostris extrusa]